MGLPFHPSTPENTAFNRSLVASYEELIAKSAQNVKLVTLSNCGCSFLAQACLNVIEALSIPLVVIPNIHLNDGNFLNPTLCRVITRANTIICRTEPEAAFFKRTFPNSEDRVRVIPVFRPISSAMQQLVCHRPLGNGTNNNCYIFIDRDTERIP